MRHPDVLERLRAEERTGGGDDVPRRGDQGDAAPAAGRPAVVRRLPGADADRRLELPAGVDHRALDLPDPPPPRPLPGPRQFRPERFLGDDAPGTYEWLPFGGGIRRCLGASFALYEMRIVLRDGAAAGAPRHRSAVGAPESVTRRAITLAPTRGARIVVEAA